MAEKRLSLSAKKRLERQQNQQANPNQDPRVSIKQFDFSADNQAPDTQINALDVAKEQFSEGTMSDVSRDKILDETRKNIEAAGGDRQAGIEATRERLAGITRDVATEQEPITTPVSEEPVTPAVAEPIEQVSTESIKAPKVEAFDPFREPKTVKPKFDMPTVVDSAQDIKSKQLQNQALEQEQVTREQEKTIKEFNEAALAGNLDTIKQLAVENPDLRGVFNSGLKLFYKQQGEQNFFDKYSNASNDELASAKESGDLVIGSEKYNKLPEETRKRFESYNKLQTSTQKTDFTNDNNNVISMESIVKDLGGVFESDIRENIEAKLNNPKLQASRLKMKNLQDEIDAIDATLDELEDAVRAEFEKLPLSLQNSEIAKRQKDLLRKKNTLTNKYDSELGLYKDMKDDIELEFDISKIEDQARKDKYMTALKIYETRRSEMREDEKFELQQRNKILAEQRSQTFQKEMVEFKTKIENENLKGKWIQLDDGVYYGKPDGTATKVIDGGKWTENDDGTKSYLTLGENGEPVQLNYDITGDLITFSGVSGGDDFSRMSGKYPGEAWAKNNNPAGLTFTESALNRMRAAGINVSKGTDRPPEEGGAYFNFATIQDGLAGYDNLWNQSWYQNKTVSQALSTWGTGSLRDFVDDKARYDAIKGKTVNQISQEDLNWIQRAQLQKESPGLVTEMSNRGWITGGGWNIPTKADYLERRNAKKALSKEEFNQFDKIVSKFKSDQQVKSFENSLVESKNLLASLSRENGVGDMAGIFQFMKTLDPTSVVRESEFESAAATAGVGTAWAVKAEGLITGVKLDTKQQRIEFQKLAKQFITNRADTYDRIYDDSLRIYERQGLDPELFPTRASDEVFSLMTISGESTGNSLIDEYNNTNISSAASNLLDINGL